MPEELKPQEVEMNFAELSDGQKFLTAGGGSLAGIFIDAAMMHHNGVGGLILGATVGAMTAFGYPMMRPMIENVCKEFNGLAHKRKILVQERLELRRTLTSQEQVDTEPLQQVMLVSPSDANEWDETWYDADEDVAPLPSIVDSSRFTFSQVLTQGFVPTLHKIYLGRLSDGTDIFVEAKDLCHVALAGNTGGGKSSLMRLIMAQLCAIGVRVLLLNPHYMRYDRSGNEDWTPFDPYLEKPPIGCAQYEVIKTYLKWAVDDLLPRRIERARDGKAIGKPFFLVIDELPAIVGELKEVPGYIAKLLREGRKYGIYLIVASQDFLVKTTGMDGGGVRKCFRTAMYVGGDLTTANVLLNVQEKIPENDLGKGTIMLRCATTKNAVLAKVPYVDNESLYTLLGPSTFSVNARDDDSLEHVPVYGEVNDKRPVYEDVNEDVNEPMELSGNVIEGVFINTVRETPSHTQKVERAPVNDEIRKHIRRMNEMGYPHREVSKIVGLYGQKYALYRQVCAEEGIAVEKEA